MSLQDSLFAEEVEDDVTLFSQSVARKRVLVFPPVNNYRRFLIHQIVQDHFDELKTFSIGQEGARRTVVCFKSDLIKDPKLNGVQGFWSKEASDKTSTMGIKDRRSPSASPENTRNRPVKSTPAVEIYRPPAARRGRGTSNTVVASTGESAVATKINRQRRPDRAVYVPKHRRSTDSEEIPQPQEDSLKVDKKNKIIKTTNTTCESSKIELDTSVKLEEESSKPSSVIDLPISFIPEELNSKDLVIESSLELCFENNENTKIDQNDSDSNEFEDTFEDCISDMKFNTEPDNSGSSVIIENDTEIKLSEKVADDKDVIPVKRFVVSDVLIISDCDSSKNKKKEQKKVEEESPMTVRQPEKKPKKVSRAKSKPASPPLSPIKLNRDECDWDSLFDDNGECLDPTLIEELNVAVGEVAIEKPKNDYKAFTRTVEVSSDEFAHVVEIYNFPSEFKTSDLAAVFTPFQNRGFELKWVDDTHCLGVFSSPLVAAEVLSSDHPFVKTRPLSEATSLSKTKARKSAETLQPYRSRPETCAALARRLVTGALGVKLATARQEREQEKRVLREAKERKRLANKQRDDAWEGIITPK